MRHGLHTGDQVSVRVADVAEIARTMARLRADLPVELTGLPVTVRDLLPRKDAVVLCSDPARPDGVRLVVRPSGTEPKLKCYLEVTEPVSDAADLPRARSVATDRLTQLRERCQF